MKSEYQEIDYSIYDEELIPTKVVLTKRQGDISIEIEVDGYKGEKSGEVYYSRDTLIWAENIIKEVNQIGVGLILSFNIPRFTLIPKEQSTSRAVRDNFNSDTYGVRQFSFAT